MNHVPRLYYQRNAHGIIVAQSTDVYEGRDGVMGNYGFLYIFDDLLIFVLFAVSNFILMKRRFEIAKTTMILLCCLIVIAGLNITIIYREGVTFALTMLPLTAYIPMMACTHILSKSGFTGTAAIWVIGLLETFCLSFLKKILKQLPMLSTGTGQGSDVAKTILLLVFSVLLLIVLVRYVKAPFRRYVLEMNINWFTPGLPIFFSFVLFSYFINDVTNPVVFLLLFLTVISILLLIYKMLVSIERERRIKESEDMLTLQMESQRRQYEEIRRKFEMGRTYRHDMKHHLATLDTLIQQSDAKEATDYIHELRGQFKQIELETYCEDATINAVLSYYIGQAKEAGCKVDAEMRVFGDLPFETLDLCIIFANALDNAIQACSKLKPEERYIKFRASFANEQNLVISIENPCLGNISFDKDGLPSVPRSKNHGIGLRSIQAVAKKYNGILACNLEGHIFYTRVIVFVPRPDLELPVKTFSPAKKIAKNMLVLMLTVILSVNLFPETALALDQVPVAGAFLRIISLNNYRFQWGATSIDIEAPTAQMTLFDTSLVSAKGHRAERKDKSRSGKVLALDDLGSESASLPEIPIDDPALAGAVADLNEDMSAYIEQLKQKFLWYVARKYDGYVALDTSYKILCNNEEMLSLRFDTTINVGGSGQYARCFTLDKRAGKVIDLADLFRTKSLYVSVISEEILKQMRRQVDLGTADYFIPGGIWSEEECFQKIDEDQNFYINNQGKLVIVFDEYQVAPGSMGCPEFIIPTAVMKQILKASSLVK